MAKRSEVLSAEEFRDRARREYEDRRAEGKLGHARTTCVNLDTKADVTVCMDALSKDNALFVDLHLPSYLSFHTVQPVLA